MITIETIMEHLFNVCVSGEMLESGIVNAYLLEDDEALILCALEEYLDKSGEGIYFF